MHLELFCNFMQYIRGLLGDILLARRCLRESARSLELCWTDVIWQRWFTLTGWMQLGFHSISAGARALEALLACHRTAIGLRVGPCQNKYVTTSLIEWPSWYEAPREWDHSDRESHVSGDRMFFSSECSSIGARFLSVIRDLSFVCIVWQSRQF